MTKKLVVMPLDRYSSTVDARSVSQQRLRRQHYISQRKKLFQSSWLHCTGRERGDATIHSLESNRASLEYSSSAPQSLAVNNTIPLAVLLFSSSRPKPIHNTTRSSLEENRQAEFSSGSWCIVGERPFPSRINCEEILFKNTQNRAPF